RRGAHARSPPAHSGEPRARDRGRAGVRAGAGRPRPRRRAQIRARPVRARRRAGGRVSAAARTLRPYVMRQWKAPARARGRARAPGVRTAADLAKPWPLALVVDHLLSDRRSSFDLQPSDWRLLAAVAALTLAIAVAEATAQYFCDLWLQSAGERITHELRI